MRVEALRSIQVQDNQRPKAARRWLLLDRSAGHILIGIALTLCGYGLFSNYATRRYLRGFSDAIVPLQGSEQEKTEALLRWFRNGPQRLDRSVEGIIQPRDPVIIVKNMRLLKICGSASNAFTNLADAAGLKTRRLLLLDQAGNAMHVVAEVRWGDRWVVADPQQGNMFRDRLGRALTKEELRDPETFRDSISRIPGYPASFTFERTSHIRLKRIPVLGEAVGRTLDRIAPRWDEAVNWGYVPDNPSLWLVLASLPLLVLAVLSYVTVNRRTPLSPSSQGQPSANDGTGSFHERINHVWNLRNNRPHGS